LAQCHLELHPQKTKIVYCKDDDRTGNYLYESFDFLGFVFRPRGAKGRTGNYFVGFLPAVSSKAGKAIRATVRSWRLHRMSDKSLLDLSRMFNPIIRGWLNYYGSYYRSALYPLWDHLNRTLKRWAMRKFKRLRGRQRRAAYWLRRIKRQQPGLFAHWQLASLPLAGR
jgi:RNA-directed DNA polymerase